MASCLNALVDGLLNTYVSHPSSSRQLYYVGGTTWP